MRVTDAARAAFAIGFAQATASHPVGITESARLSLSASILLAEESPEHAAAVVEATLQLGQLEGVWAVVYDRRLGLIKDGLDKAMARWAELLPDLSGPVRLARNQAGLASETTAPPDPTLEAAASALLAGVHDDAELQKVLEEWVRRAHAEGKADALGLAAHDAGYTAFDFDLAFTDAYEALLNLDSINADALKALGKATGDMATELGTRLSELAAQQASYAEMLTAAEDLFTSSRAAIYWIDTALAAGLSQGAVNLYRTENVTTVSWVSAGDARVCPECEGNEEGSPYDINSNLPIPPQHGFCRCCLTADDLGQSAWSPYVSDLNLDDG